MNDSLPIEPVRLARRVAELAGCSRREAELYIEGGWVEVDGQVVEEPQHRVTTEAVLLRPGARPDPLPPVTLLWHRPEAHAAAGAPCDAAPLREQPPQVAAGAPPLRVLRRHFLQQQALAPLEGLATGLVVFTQDGRIARRLTEDAATLEEELMVALPGQVPDATIEQLRERLLREPAWRRWPAVPVIGKLSLNARGPQGTRLRVALKGSDAARVQALCATAGLKPQAITRTRLGRVALAGLAPGAWRFLGPHERF